MTFIALQKCKKECESGVRFFNIAQFPDGFRLKFNFISSIFFIFQTFSKASKLSKDFLQFLTSLFYKSQSFSFLTEYVNFSSGKDIKTCKPKFLSFRKL